MKEDHKKTIGIFLPSPPTIDEIRKVVQECLQELQNKNLPSDYSKKEFAKKIDKSTSWVDARRREGKLKWFKRGGEIRIPHSELVRLTQF